MNTKLHIIVTGEEGGVRPFVISKRLLKCSLCLLLLIFCTAAISGIIFPLKNIELHARVSGLESDLYQAKAEKNDLQGRLAELERTVEEPLKDAVTELSQRSKIIESILTTVGIKIPISEDPDYSGGPFTQIPVEYLDDSVDYEDLLYRADRYLEVIQPVPLGFPLTGVITSKFGKRIDPFNKKPAFHAGIDIKNKTGTKIRATGDGIVHRQAYDRQYGRFVLIDHGNGFKSMFAHNKRNLVKKGEKVTRGQVIGRVGNTGRSTGPHLHYELRYKEKVINPRKFMKIAKSIPLNSGEK